MYLESVCIYVESMVIQCLAIGIIPVRRIGEILNLIQQKSFNGIYNLGKY